MPVHNIDMHIPMHHINMLVQVLDNLHRAASARPVQTVGHHD